MSDTVKEQRDQLDKKKRRLEDDVDRYKKKLHDTEKHLKVKNNFILYKIIFFLEGARRQCGDEDRSTGLQTIWRASDFSS